MAETLEWLSTDVLAETSSPNLAGIAGSVVSPSGLLSPASGAAGGSGSAADGSGPLQYSYSAFLGAAPNASLLAKDKLRQEFVDMVSRSVVVEIQAGAVF